MEQRTPLLTGTLFLIVGPSGVGKDTLIDYARAALQDTGHFHFSKRTITRPSEAGGEEHEAVDRAHFATLIVGEAFAVHWDAHETRYGIRRTELAPLADGINVVVNASRTAIEEFAALADRCVVLSITAPPELVKARLAARGREDASRVAARMARTVQFSAAVRCVEINNDGPPEIGGTRLLEALTGAAVATLKPAPAALSLGPKALAVLPDGAFALNAGRLSPGARVEVTDGSSTVFADLAVASAPHGPLRGEVGLDGQTLQHFTGGKVIVRRPSAPTSIEALQAKIAGETIPDHAFDALLTDLLAMRYSDGEAAAFLAAAARNLTIDETVALTKARLARLPRLTWDAPIVVDKHAIGGIPGSRISLIVVPIVVAHGLTMPKTSSHAITSAAGTADVVACIAEVDLDAVAMQRVVGETGGCLVSNAKLTQSQLDRTVNAIARPLRLGSGPLDVSSILSKKVALGVTHTVIDIPVGPQAKVRTRADAEALAALFEAVGAGVGLTVRAEMTDGTAPIGRGVGPLLELEDVRQVLDGAAPNTPLTNKALEFAGAVLEFDPNVAPGQGMERARELLDSGAARTAFEAIITAQGRRRQPDRAVFRADVTASKTGVLTAIDGFALAGAARTAGAPQAPGAGVWLHAEIGAEVEEGMPLATVYAASEEALKRTLGRAGAVYTITAPSGWLSH